MAIRTARLRGVRHAEVLSITEISSRLGTFDTFLLLGSGFGLFGNPARARWLLRRFEALARPGAKIIGGSIEVDRIDDDHTAYAARNRRIGAIGGQMRLRARHKRYITPWFDFLWISKNEMEQILDGTGWRVRAYHDCGCSPTYTAILERHD